MIDISNIKVGGKTYSVKTSVDIPSDRQTLILKILSVSEVNMTSRTSFSKVKTVYSAGDEIKFNVIKYKDLFNAISSKLAAKYKITNIRYDA